MVPNFQTTQDSPLSLQGEGWGEGALNPNTYAPGKPLSRASSLLRRAPRRGLQDSCSYVVFWVPAFAGMTMWKDGAGLPGHSGQPPLPSGRGLGRGCSQPQHLRPWQTPSRASSLLRRAPRRGLQDSCSYVVFWVPAFAGMTRNGESYQDDSELPTHSERPPLPLGEGWGEGCGLRRYLAAWPVPPTPQLRRSTI